MIGSLLYKSSLILLEISSSPAFSMDRSHSTQTKTRKSSKLELMKTVSKLSDYYQQNNKIIISWFLVVLIKKFVLLLFQFLMTIKLHSNHCQQQKFKDPFWVLTLILLTMGIFVLLRIQVHFLFTKYLRTSSQETKPLTKQRRVKRNAILTRKQSISSPNNLFTRTQ